MKLRQSGRGNFCEKLTSAWKTTSNRFHLIFNSQRYCALRRKFLIPKKKLSLWLDSFLIFLFAMKIRTLTLGRKVFIWLFNLCFTRNFYYSSHMHEELCLYFAVKYFMSEKFCPCRTQRERSKHYEIFTKSYKLHRKLLHRIEY